MRFLLPVVAFGCSQGTPPSANWDVVIIDTPGPPPSTDETELFDDHGPVEVDVLFLVDPALDDDDLAAYLPALAASFRDDRAWRIGVASLAPGSAPAVLDAGDGDPAAFLAAAMGEILASEPGPALALDAIQAVPDFFRPGSAVSVALVTGPTPDESTVSPDASAAWAASFRPDWRTFAVHELAPCGAPRHAAVVATSGGTSAERCAAGSADPLADELVLGEWGYTLGTPPLPETLQVTVEQEGYVVGFLAGSDWVFEPVSNRVVFVAYRPAPDTTVVVNYEPLAE